MQIDRGWAFYRPPHHQHHQLCVLHQFDSPAATAGGGGPVRRLEDMIRNLNVSDISTTPSSSPVVVVDVVVLVWRVVSVSVRALRSVSGRSRITAAATTGVTVVPVAATVLVTPESTQTQELCQSPVVQK